MQFLAVTPLLLVGLHEVINILDPVSARFTSVTTGQRAVSPILVSLHCDTIVALLAVPPCAQLLGDQFSLAEELVLEH